MSESDEAWTIRRMLGWMAEDFAARGVPSPRLDAEVLLAQALQVPRVHIYLEMERPLSSEEKSAVRGFVQRRRAHEPVAYILGQRDFYSRSFSVDPRVLIPRPDTETLVDEALARLPTGEGRALDLCTGSGCVAATLAAERPGLMVDATDLSEDALAVARANAEQLEVAPRVRFLAGDLWNAVPTGTRYDVITANPPYVTETEFRSLEPGVAKHEPRMALVAEDNGLAFYRRIAERACEFLTPTGHLLVEVGHEQAGAVRQLFAPHFVTVSEHRDLGGIARVVAASRSAAPAADHAEPHVEASDPPPPTNITGEPHVELLEHDPQTPDDPPQDHDPKAKS